MFFRKINENSKMIEMKDDKFFDVEDILKNHLTIIKKYFKQTNDYLEIFSNISIININLNSSKQLPEALISMENMK